MQLGLITIYQVPNYGSVLQTYATQKVLELMGHRCIIINYRYPNEWHYSRGAKRPIFLRELIKKLGLKSHHRKELALNNFKKKQLNFSPLYSSFSELQKEIWNKYDAIIVGSDQVWNPRFLKGDRTFLLSFVPDNIRKLSIASSFAQKELPSEFISTYRECLSRLDAISVREQNGVNIINTQLSIAKDVFICLDPTLLLKKDEWKMFIPRSGFKKKRPYILVYMLKYAFDPLPYFWDVVRYYQKKMNCDVFVLAGYSIQVSRTIGNMVDMTDATVPEFIDLFDNADLVITSSFHGTAFAINFSIPLLSIVPDNDGDDRQSSFLNEIGAKNCITIKGTEFTSLNPYYDVNAVESKLQNMRNESLDWIKKSISPAS